MKLVLPAGGWRPRPHQQKVWEALEAGFRFVLVVGHRRWGKDDLGLRWNSVQCARKAANYFYMLPQSEHVRRAIWTAINPHSGKRRIAEAFPQELIRGDAKEQEMAIDCVTGARTQFLGSDNYNAIVGAGPFGLTFSEWALADPQAFALLRPILLENKGWALFLTTPRGKNHVYTMLKEFKGESDWAIFYDPADQTGVFTQEELRAEQRQLHALYGPEVGEALFKQEYFCEFVDVVPGSLYGDLMVVAERDGRVSPMAVPLEEPIWAAFDIGWSDATAIWYAQIRRDGWVDLVGYEEYRKKSAGDIAQILRTHAWNYGGLLLPHDAAQSEASEGQTYQSVLERLGFRTMLMPQTNEFAQIQSVRMLLPRCRYDEESTERGRTCMKAYHVKRLDDLQDWSMKAVHDWSSHGAKAFATLAYFADELRGGPRPTIAKPLFPDRGVGGSRTGWMRGLAYAIMQLCATLSFS